MKFCASCCILQEITETCRLLILFAAGSGGGCSHTLDAFLYLNLKSQFNFLRISCYCIHHLLINGLKFLSPIFFYQFLIDIPVSLCSEKLTSCLFTKLIQANAPFSKYFYGFRKALRKKKKERKIGKKKEEKKEKPVIHLYADKTERRYKTFTFPDGLMLRKATHEAKVQVPTAESAPESWVGTNCVTWDFCFVQFLFQVTLKSKHLLLPPPLRYRQLLSPYQINQKSGH